MNPNRITVHCSASRTGRYLTASEIRQMHLSKGWSDIGYHFVIRTDGAVEAGRPITKQGAHVYGYNKDNIGICLVGGLNREGKATNNYTDAQFHALYALIVELCETHEISYAEVCGHRDFSKDLNGDGKITSEEFIKECPCFDVRPWLFNLLTENEV